MGACDRWSGGQLDVAEEVGEALALAVHFRGIVTDLAGVEAALVGAFDGVLAAGQIGEDFVERGGAGVLMRCLMRATGGTGSDRGEGLGFSVHSFLTQDR
jgi:hypothetical protein